ncbi:MAG: NAD(P)H-hydrate dehydratase, partial [Acidobacteria bacterium]|nr:NAD(P)H-hydrate dehydratase [Acidobacteriota bacterium]
VAGSRGKSGAALMTGMAALRSGAGLVTLWLPESLGRDLTGKFPELMTEYLPETGSGALDSAGAEAVLRSQKQYDTMVLGPGMTTQRSTRALVHSLVREADIPIVLDADGINAFAGRPELLRNRQGRPLVITPHPGEMARLIGSSIREVQRSRLEVAVQCATRSNLHVLLKGFQTVIATPAGQAWINCTGNPGMATGGSGDILAGMTGRFVAAWWRRCHGMDAGALADSLVAAAYLHGLAGDLAAAELGEESLVATDLLPRLPAAFQRVKGL